MIDDTDYAIVLGFLMTLMVMPLFYIVPMKWYMMLSIVVFTWSISFLLLKFYFYKSKIRADKMLCRN